MVGGDVEAEAFGDEAEEIAGGEALKADGDILANGDGCARGRRRSAGWCLPW